MPDLLPTDDARRILESIHEANCSFYRDPRGIGALKDLQQTFPNPWLYVAELLQNAVDEGATRIDVKTGEDGSLVFEHNGNSFTEANVRALCARGVSGKGASTVGFMGIGFKSVFRSYQSVEVSSDSWRFALTVPIKRGEEYGDQQRDWLGAVLPQWEATADAPSPEMKCRFALLNRLPDLPAPAGDLERVLGDNETLLALLAWQGVKELSWDGKTWLLERHETPLGEEGDLRVLLEALDGDGNTCRRWMLFSKCYQPSRQAIARFLEHRQISPTPEEREKVHREASQRRQVAVFCEIDDLEVPLPLKRGSAYALLPTGVTFPLGLHVQADWLLVVTRRGMMQIQGEKWHEEILEQLPTLVRYYLEWLVSSHDKAPDGWHRGYDALPDPPLKDVDSDEWFGSDTFLLALRKELVDLSFLPKPPAQDGTVAFLPPSTGRFLPMPFTKEFEDVSTRPDVLFGDRIIGSRLLGARARQCLERLGLLKELTADDLVVHWNMGVVSGWLALLLEDARKNLAAEAPADVDSTTITDAQQKSLSALKQKMLVGILQALVELEDREDWKRALLVCLPTASGGWAHRRAVDRYPPDWSILAQEDDIRNVLEPFVGTAARLVAWDFDSSPQLSRSPARSYLAPVPQPKFEDVVRKWWDCMPRNPLPEHVGLVVRFAKWVLEKQSTRKGLVQRLLCLDDTGNLCLLPNAESVLAEPYAGGYRRLFYPKSPAVSPAYETCGSTKSRAEWRAFLESLEPAPKGAFALYLNASQMSWTPLVHYVGAGYRPPERRASRMATEWRGITVGSDNYTVVDVSLPPVLDTMLYKSVTREQFSAISQWLGESPAFLGTYRSVLLVYIPRGGSSVNADPLPKKAQWVNRLREASWVYATSGDGPFRPCDILAYEDPARPDAPDADLSVELLEALQQSGIEFGSALPDAPAIDRLRIQGPAAPSDQLLEFLEAAIKEADDDENKKDFLRKTLRERQLFPMPPGHGSVDGAVRVHHGRLVWNERGRSIFGNWLVAIDSLPEGSPDRKVLEAVDSFLPVPLTTIFSQSLDFLSWVWSTTPNADLVRQLLPRAYQYVQEDLTTDKSLLERWNAVLPDVRVFVQNKRKWVRIVGSDNLFLDDLNESSLDEILVNVDLATPGHFAENAADQLAVAQRLGVNRLSSRFRIAVEPKGSLGVPNHWQQGFGAIQDWLRGQLKDEDDRGSAAKGVPEHNMKLSHWQTLRTVVYDSGTQVHERQVRASVLPDRSIGVSGSPDEFAEELCKVLFTQWGLRLRRDLVDLLPRVAIQLTKLDQEATVAKWLSGTTPGGTEKPAGTAPAPTPPGTSPPAVGGQPATGTGNGGATGTFGGAGGGGTTASGGPTVTPPPSGGEPPGQGGSHTADDREARLERLINKRQELDDKIRQALASDVDPVADIDDASASKTGELPTDAAYRLAVVKYERERGRHAELKDDKQEGHDIDSYTHPEEDPDRRLIRRIEVKGRGRLWDADEIVEMSKPQFHNAIKQLTEGEALDDDFDYWLYVVETDENGKLNVLPIRNAAELTAKFSFRGGSWRHMVRQERAKGMEPEDNQSQQ